jgi:hypothetical protein
VLVQAVARCPIADVPRDLEDAYLAAHAWSSIVRAGATRDASSATPHAPVVSLTLLQRAAASHTARAQQVLRGRIRMWMGAGGLEPASRRALVRLSTLLDANDQALHLALQLIGQTGGFDAGGAMRHWEWSEATLRRGPLSWTPHRKF